MFTIFLKSWQGCVFTNQTFDENSDFDIYEANCIFE